jgi:hypothetical protein
MRATLFAIITIAGASAASAEVWDMREGMCGEWQSRWNVEQTQDGFWVGFIDHVHVGGPCIRASGKRARSDVRAVLLDETLFGVRHIGGAYCSYYGQRRGDRVSGIELCEGTPMRLSFVLRFPPGQDWDARQRHQGRKQDEWVDEPETDRPSEFQFDPRR